MTSLSTAKILFLIAMSLGPQKAQTIVATSNSDVYVWTQSSNGWSLRTETLPDRNWVDQGRQAFPANTPERHKILTHDWCEDDLLDLSDGNQVMMQGDAGFYIVDPGAANQKVYTICYPSKRSTSLMP